MTMKPYPSNIIIFNIDERIFNNDVKLALKRSWTHIGEILVRSHAGDEDLAPCNFMHVVVKYGTRSYISNADEESNAYWAERMEQHLLSTMRKISNNNIAFNRRQRKSGDTEIHFDYIEFELERGALTLEYRLDSNDSLPSNCAHIATEIRTALHAGILGEPTRIKIPSTRSYNLQLETALEEVSREVEENMVEETEETSPDEWFVESPELAEELEQQEIKESKKSSPFEIAPLTEEEWEATYGVADPDFEIDYHIWEAVYADGSSREYDAHIKEFVA